MEAAKLVEVLSATLVPDQRQQAEQHLNEVLVTEQPLLCHSFNFRFTKS